MYIYRERERDLDLDLDMIYNMAFLFNTHHHHITQNALPKPKARPAFFGFNPSSSVSYLRVE